MKGRVAEGESAVRVGFTLAVVLIGGSCRQHLVDGGIACWAAAEVSDKVSDMEDIIGSIDS